MTRPPAAYIHRGAGGSLWFNIADYVDVPYQNIGEVATKGIDLEGDYHLTWASMGTAGVQPDGHLHGLLHAAPIPGVNYDCAGFYGSTCGAPLPKWRHVLNRPGARRGPVWT